MSARETAVGGTVTAVNGRGAEMSRPARRRRLLIATATASLLLAIIPASATSGTSGSAGKSDPFFPQAGNGGYDVRHYNLSLSYHPSTHRLRAATTIRAVAHRALRRFDLDFRGLSISRLGVNGRQARFIRSGQELVVTPARVLPAGQTFHVFVGYAGRPHPVIDPDGSLDGWVPTGDGAFVADEPQGAPSWFPSNDYPTDKATYRFKVTVPRGTNAIANGRLQKKATGRHHTTFVWSERHPMATYLSTVTTGKFNIIRSRTRSGIPIYDAVDARESRATRVLHKIPGIVRFYTSKFGSYPFETVGAIVDHAPRVGYALESQTKPVFDRAPSVQTLAHELSHQWFGDDVTLKSWPNIWLNEGFATFSQWLYRAHTGGTTVHRTFRRLYRIPASDKAFWNPPPRRVGSPKRLFDGTVYDRGGMTLQALRERIGSHDFFLTLRTWVARHAYSHATTAQFIRLAEQISGRDLTRFFKVWLFERGKPRNW